MRCPSCGHCFVPDTRPSLESMLAYGAKIELPADQVERCFDYYESNGWMVGKVKMKSVEAAMRNWKRNWAKSGSPALVRLAQSLPLQKQPQPQLSAWAIEKKLEAIKQERVRLKNIPSRQARMKDYKCEDGTILKVQDGWIFTPEVQAALDKLEQDATTLKQALASV